MSKLFLILLSFLFYFIVVPFSSCPMASAFVMSTRPTPLPMASRAFSIFGIMPPAMVPSATRSLKSGRVMLAITYESSSGLESTPGFSKQ